MTDFGTHTIAEEPSASTGPQQIDWLEFHAGPPTGDATRHLCAAAYLDRDFRRTAIEELLVNSYRVPAPTPGTDHLRVLYECLQARREDLYSAAAVIAVTLIGLVVSFTSAGILIGLSVLGYVLRRLPVAALTPQGRQRNLSGLDGGKVINGLEKTSKAVDYLISAAYLLTAVVLGLGLGLGGSTAVSFTLPLFLAYLVIGSVFQLRRHVRLASLREPPEPVPQPSDPRRAAVFQRLRARQAEAETVYGDFSPFVGCGAQLRPWSYDIDLGPSPESSAEGRAPDPLSVEDLHARIGAGLWELTAGQSYWGDPLRRLTVRDRVFRSGIRADVPARWLGGLSSQTAGGVAFVAPEWARALDDRAHERIRHYVEARAELWQDQVVVSTFLRVCVQGSLLYVEGLPFVLPPIDRRYQAVDVLTQPDSLGDGVAAVVRGLRNLPTTVVGAVVDPVGLFLTAWRARDRDRRYRKMIKRQLPVDHAPGISVREAAAEETYEQYFQYLDVERLIRTVRLRVIRTLSEELARAGYDTGKLQQIIQNIGIQNNNSTVNGDQAVFDQISPPGSHVG